MILWLLLLLHSKLLLCTNAFLSHALMHSPIVIPTRGFPPETTTTIRHRDSWPSLLRAKGVVVEDEYDDALEIVDDSSSSDLSPESLEALEKSLENITSALSYFYLQDEVGLSEETMQQITLHAGSALGMRVNTVRRKVELLRDTLELTRDDLEQILQTQPTLLHLSADQNLAPTMLYLMRTLELTKQDLKHLVVNVPCILGYKISTLQSKINFFFKIMGLDVTETRNSLLKEPCLIRSSAEEGLLTRFRFLLRELDIPLDQVKTIVQANPRILTYSLDNNLVPKLIIFCIMTLHMENSDVARLLTSYPAFVDYNLDRHIVPIFEYFVQELEFQPIEFRRILLRYPRVITYSMRNIKHVVGYLRFELGLQAEQVKRVLFQSPQVIGINTDQTLAAKLEWIKNRLHLSTEELGVLVAGMPTLLNLSSDRNLGPKLDYLESRCKDKAVVRAIILSFPPLLGYSLNRRIQPRLEAILESGCLSPEYLTIGIPMKEENFAPWLERRVLKAKEATNEETNSATIPDPSQRITHWTRN